MTHYEERLERDLGRIRAGVTEIGAAVRKAVGNALRALATVDRELAAATILGDHPINRRIRELDGQCHAFVARHLPSAGHLRYVSSVLRLAVALERIGDYAVTIARETAQLSGPPPETVARDVAVLGDQTRGMLGQALEAFGSGDEGLARGTMGMAGQVNLTFGRVFDELVRVGERRGGPLKDLFAVLVIFSALNRVGDQAKNICEETLFAVAGETKQPKVYRVLFIDERNDFESQMAEAFARKGFPNSGRYDSAGWSPAPELDPAFRRFLDAQGCDLRRAAPTHLDHFRRELDRYHVIMSFSGDPRAHLGEIPFHTVILVRDVGTRPASLEGPQATERMLETGKRVAHEVRELMETLRGEGAG